jgi:hypothetical protein
MDPRQYVDTRVKRYMAQCLEEFEKEIELPLREARAMVFAAGDDVGLSKCLQQAVNGIEPTKRAIRKRLQTLGSDCLDIMPDGLHINGYEPIITRS